MTPTQVNQAPRLLNHDSFGFSLKPVLRSQFIFLGKSNTILCKTIFTSGLLADGTEQSTVQDSERSPAGRKTALARLTQSTSVAWKERKRTLNLQTFKRRWPQQQLLYFQSQVSTGKERTTLSASASGRGTRRCYVNNTSTSWQSLCCADLHVYLRSSMYKKLSI